MGGKEEIEKEGEREREGKGEIEEREKGKVFSCIVEYSTNSSTSAAGTEGSQV